MSKIKIADYIAQRCEKAGARHVFLVTGGGAMFLNDAFGRNQNLKKICFHHEQAASIAAESYFRTNNRLAVLNVTTGPGGINALNGVYGAYVDSLGMLVISGQVKKETYLRSYSTPLRQLGDQEVDIVSMVKPIVKYSVTLFDPKDVKKVMDKAIYLALNGRPGPVWIDVPIDVQSFQVNPEELLGWDNNLNELMNDSGITDNTLLELKELKNKSYDEEISLIIKKLLTSKRPVLMVGTGIRISNQYDNFIKLIKKLGIPVVTGWNAHDVLSNDNDFYAGKPGTVGDRAGNFTVQNADLLLILGCRLNIRQISYNWKNFANRAYKIMVDVDRAELDKITLSIDLKIHANLTNFLPDFLSALNDYQPPTIHKNYLDWCKQRVIKYPTVLSSYSHGETYLNPYIFINYFFKNLKKDDIVITANGSSCVITFQVAEIKEGQRLFTNSGNASMGYDLPAAIGACLANNNQRVICIAGDGSIMMNLQELQTIVGHRLPIKIIVLNNNGYLSIKQTQKNYFSDNVFGTSPEDGVTMPNFVRISEGFNLTAYQIKTMDDWNNDEVQSSFKDNNPALFEIICDPDQTFSPKLAAKKLPDGSLLAPSLENMSPFLSDEELSQNVIKD